MANTHETQQDSRGKLTLNFDPFEVAEFLSTLHNVKVTHDYKPSWNED